MGESQLGTSIPLPLFLALLKCELQPHTAALAALPSPVMEYVLKLRARMNFSSLQLTLLGILSQ